MDILGEQVSDLIAQFRDADSPFTEERARQREEGRYEKRKAERLERHERRVEVLLSMEPLWPEEIEEFIAEHGHVDDRRRLSDPTLPGLRIRANSREPSVYCASGRLTKMGKTHRLDYVVGRVGEISFIEARSRVHLLRNRIGLFTDERLVRHPLLAVEVSRGTKSF